MIRFARKCLRMVWRSRVAVASVFVGLLLFDLVFGILRLLLFQAGLFLIGVAVGVLARTRP